MKHKLVQVLFLLCLALLVLLLWQNLQMREEINHLNREIHQLRTSVEEEIRSISYQLRQELEDSQRIIAEYGLQPKGISKDDHTLLADVSVILKEWYTDTQLTLLTQIGHRQTELPMEADKNGRFTAEIAIPLEESCEIGLAVQISGGGMTKQETAGNWSELSMLLPLQNGGGGWTGPAYQDGTMSSSFTISIRGRDGLPGAIENPRFQIYRNGELVQTIPAVVDPNSYSSDSIVYTVDSPGHRWQLDCNAGDAVDIRFLCEDEYGLGYDFLFGNWLAEEGNSGSYNGAQFQSGSSAVAFYWPE